MLAATAPQAKIDLDLKTEFRDFRRCLTFAVVCSNLDRDFRRCLTFAVVCSRDVPRSKRPEKVNTS